VIFHDGVHDSILQHDDNRRVIVALPNRSASALPHLSTTSLQQHVLSDALKIDFVNNNDSEKIWFYST
jgi:hypothetical protein